MARKRERYLHNRGGVFYFRKKHNGRLLRRSLNTSDRRTAEDLRDLYLGNLVEYGQLDPPQKAEEDIMTFGRVAKEWAAIHKTQVRHSSWPDYVSAMNGHILPVFKDMPIEEITYRDVLKFRSGLEGGVQEGEQYFSTDEIRF